MSKIRPSGGYRALRSFQAATIIYDATYWFCERFVDGRSRMHDQMLQAARSGRQNIAEGSRASGTSSQTELRLVNVARASLEELLLDYEDFLRHRRLRSWKADDSEAVAVRQVAQQHDRSDPTDRTDHPEDCGYSRYARWLDHEDPAIRANALICLIHQTNFLLDKQIAALEAQFITEGGYSEQLATARLAEREQQRKIAQTDQTDRTDRTDRADRADPKDVELIPACPKCGSPMVLRTARKGKGAGRQFWGCTDYPTCRGTVQ